RYVVGRRIEHPRALQQARRIRQPDRVPIRLDLARCRPPRARSAIEIFKRRRVQKEGFQGHRHPFDFTILPTFGVSETQRRTDPGTKKATSRPNSKIGFIQRAARVRTENSHATRTAGLQTADSPYFSNGQLSSSLVPSPSPLRP